MTSKNTGATYEGGGVILNLNEDDPGWANYVKVNVCEGGKGHGPPSYNIRTGGVLLDTKRSDESGCINISCSTPDDHEKLTNYLEARLKMSNAHKVKQFTEESRGTTCPEYPSPMNRAELDFIMKMVLSELTEAAQTLEPDPVKAVEWVKSCAGVDVKQNYVPPAVGDDSKVIAEQYDAFVDAWYYMLNAAAKKGVNLSSIFNVVHGANMAKRWPDGTFHRRADGKVEKPPGWKEPDLVNEINRQQTEGAW